MLSLLGKGMFNCENLETPLIHFRILEVLAEQIFKSTNDTDLRLTKGFHHWVIIRNLSMSLRELNAPSPSLQECFQKYGKKVGKNQFLRRK